MANRRMFARSIICSGRFMRLSLEAQNLYYSLGMDADDDGFAEAFPRVQSGRITEEHLKELAGKGFVTVLDWEDLVVHIDGWSENNLIRKDRYTPSRYLEKYPQYKEAPAPEQNIAAQEPVQTEAAPHAEASSLVDPRLTQVRLGKDRLDQVSQEEDNSEKENIIQDNINQDSIAREAGFAPIRSCQSPESDKNASLAQEKPSYIQISPENSKLFDDFASSPGNPGDLEAEFNQKRRKSMTLLLNSEYFSKERAAPGKLQPV